MFIENATTESLEFRFPITNSYVSEIVPTVFFIYILRTYLYLILRRTLDIIAILGKIFYYWSN